MRMSSWSFRTTKGKLAEQKTKLAIDSAVVGCVGDRGSRSRRTELMVEQRRSSKKDTIFVPYIFSSIGSISHIYYTSSSHLLILTNIVAFELRENVLNSNLLVMDSTNVSLCAPRI